MNYYIPQWEERTSYGFRRIDPYAKLFEDRIIYLGSPISDDVANAVIAAVIVCVPTSGSRWSVVTEVPPAAIATTSRTSAR